MPRMVTWPRHPEPAGVARPQEHPAHREVHGAAPGAVQELLAGLTGSVRSAIGQFLLIGTGRLTTAAIFSMVRPDTPANEISRLLQKKAATKAPGPRATAQPVARRRGYGLATLQRDRGPQYRPPRPGVRLLTSYGGSNVGRKAKSAKNRVFSV